ncbi:MAG TPA: VOC family protein [Thermoanaerobaculia bacterium]
MIETDVHLDGLMQVAVNVKDVDRATAFYRDALGLKFLFSAPGLAFFDSGGVRLMLAKPERPDLDHPSSVLYFRAGTIEDAHRALSARGVSFLTKPHVVHRADDYDLWLAEFRDSEGNILALMSEVRRG